jgi:nitroreductase
MDAIEAILTRRSIRRYTGEPIADGDVDTILHAAMAAPSAGNQRPWRFVVITDPETLTAAAASTPYGSMLLEAAVGLVVCADTRELKHPGMWQQDCSAATQNALLAAHALGLGAVWLGFWPKMERVEPLKAALRIPDGVEPLAVLAIGHPLEHKPPADRFDASCVHRDRW